MSAELLREAAADIRDDWRGAEKTSLNEARAWLAVADLLDTEAEYDDTYGNRFEAPSERRRKALAVARAYLGR